MDLKSRFSGGGELETSGSRWKLRIPAGSGAHYRLSQLDDYEGLRRSEYLWRPPLKLTLRARVSSASLVGTWGFGLWNDPFGLSLGTGTSVLRLPALPQTAWFFAASPRSYLSFRDDLPASGFFAQALRSSPVNSTLISAALAFPFAPKTTRRTISRLVQEDAIRIDSDPRAWRRYTVEWAPNHTAFSVDEALVLDSVVSPRPPLGLVAWIDNQYAAFDPKGKLRWGVEASPEDSWLEIDELQVVA